MNYSLKSNENYTKEQLETIFGTNFGARIKGITLRRQPDGAPYALVFSRADGPYDDRIEGDSFYYDGEGTNKDQVLTAANKALVNANTAGRVIYGFRQDESGGLWRYLGIIEVVDFAYVLKGSYMTYEFHFMAQPIGPDELQQAEVTIEQTLLEAPQLTEPAAMTTVSIRARKAAFRIHIKRLYENTCVVCRKKRLSDAGYPEVEAAHIYPKEKLGADDYRNGVALCKLHHWAFDSGLLTFSDDLTVIVKPEIISDDNYTEIAAYADEPILLPTDQRLSPDKLYIRAHRELHGL